MDCEIRRATSADIAVIAEISRTARNEISPGMAEIHTVDEDAHFFAHLIATETVDVAVVDSRVAGFIAYNETSISQLYFRSEFRRHGFGTALVNHVLQQVQSEISLWCFEVNRQALKFYFKRGFLPLKHTDGADNEEKLPDVLLGWHRDSGCLVRAGRVDLDWFAQHDAVWRELGIASPARRALITNDIRSFEDLRQVSVAELATLHGMGPAALKLLAKFARPQ